MFDFNLDFYFRVIRRWLWLVLITGIAAGIGAYFYFDQGEDLYETRALLNVGGYLYSPNPEFNELRIGQELAETYARLVTTAGIIQPVIDQLDLGVGVGFIRNSITPNIVANTSLLEIIVTHPDPELAAAIANAIGEQLVVASATSLTPQLRAQVDLAQTQIDLLSTQLDDLVVQLEAINGRLSEAEATGDDEMVDILTERRSDTLNLINHATSNIAQFTDTITRVVRGTNTVIVQERAPVPTAPIARQRRIFILLVGAGVAMVTAGAVTLLEAMDTTLRTAHQTEYTLKIPVRGVMRAKLQAWLTKPLKNTRLLEEYQMLRTNLVYRQRNGKVCYIVTSPTDVESKDNIISNLAMALAMADRGSRILIIDADLRQSGLHEYFQVDNHVGLVDWLELTPDDMADKAWRAEILDRAIQKTSINNLLVITNGSNWDSPTRLLKISTTSPGMDTLLKMCEFDVILVNAPPALLYSDTSTLAIQTGVDVLLIVQRGKTNLQKAQTVVDQIEQVGGRVSGVIFGR